MTLQQLKYVISVAEKGSISEAAKSLFVSQPSLSNAIHDLEAELNFSIFIRNSRGVILTREGAEFLGYARQVEEQLDLLNEQYFSGKSHKIHFSVTSQHYSFAVEAFVDIIKKFGTSEYDFVIKESRTNEIIDDVANLKSEIGVLYLNQFNSQVIGRLLQENSLEFHLLFTAVPHVFVSSKHPLADQSVITLEELEDYPLLTFEQGEFNSFYFSEEILSTTYRKKHIRVSDRATLFNLLIGLNGYTISSGVISEELNGSNIVSVPLLVDEEMKIGYIKRKNVVQSKIALAYVEALTCYTAPYNKKTY